jgi:hypothetical protein
VEWLKKSSIWIYPYSARGLLGMNKSGLWLLLSVIPALLTLLAPSAQANSADEEHRSFTIEDVLNVQ